MDAKRRHVPLGAMSFSIGGCTLLGPILSEKSSTLFKANAHASALPGFVAFLDFIDDINSAFAAHQLIGAMPCAQRFQGVANFHRSDPGIKNPAVTAGLKRT
jgi:hypothetical protein